MKRVLSFISILAILLVGCQKEETKMVLKPTERIPDKVIENYTQTLDLISYDFSLSDEIYLNYMLYEYKLVDGQWKEGSATGSVLNHNAGLIAFNGERDLMNMTITTVAGTIKYGQIRDGDIGIVSQTSSHNPNIDDQFQYLALNDEVEIVFNQEIPILVQVNTDQELTQTFTTSEEELANQFKDYDEVYLIKVVFSNDYYK